MPKPGEVEVVETAERPGRHLSVIIPAVGRNITLCRRTRRSYRRLLRWQSAASEEKRGATTPEMAPSAEEDGRKTSRRRRHNRGDTEKCCCISTKWAGQRSACRLNEFIKATTFRSS